MTRQQASCQRQVERSTITRSLPLAPANQRHRWSGLSTEFGNTIAKGRTGPKHSTAKKPGRQTARAGQGTRTQPFSLHGFANGPTSRKKTRWLTASVTCKWAGVDSVWEQRKLEARKLLEDAAPPTCQVHALLASGP